MLKILKVVKSLFNEKVFTDFITIKDGYAYGLCEDIKIMFPCNIPFDCLVSAKLLFLTLSEMKKEYVAVLDGSKITFTEAETGLIYTIDDVRPYKEMSLVFPYYSIDSVHCDDLPIFSKMMKYSEEYITAKGLPYMSDSVLLNGNRITFTDCKNIIQGIEYANFGNISIKLKTVELFNKLNKFKIVKYNNVGNELLISYENGLSVALPTYNGEVVQYNYNKICSVLGSLQLNNYFQLPNLSILGLKKLYSNKILENLTLTNNSLVGTNLSINFEEYPDIVFDNEFSIKVPLKIFKLMVEEANYVACDERVICFINKDNNLFGILGQIQDD